MRSLLCLVVLIFLSIQSYSQYSEFQSIKSKIYTNDLIDLKNQDNKSHSIFDERKNALSLDFLIIYPAAGYSRIIPFHSKAGFVVSVSATPVWGFVVDLSGGFIFGTHKHFFEPTAGYMFIADNTYAKLGYRFQGDKGLVLKIAPGWSISENVPYFTSGIGYAF